MNVFYVVKINEDEAFVYFLKLMVFIEMIINHIKDHTRFGYGLILCLKFYFSFSQISMLLKW